MTLEVSPGFPYTHDWMYPTISALFIFSFIFYCLNPIPKKCTKIHWNLQNRKLQRHQTAHPVSYRASFHSLLETLNLRKADLNNKRVTKAYSFIFYEYLLEHTFVLQFLVIYPFVNREPVVHWKQHQTAGVAHWINTVHQYLRIR